MNKTKKQILIALLVVGILLVGVATVKYFKKTNRKTADSNPVAGGAVLTMKVDVSTMAATGYRASKLLGFSIYNDQEETLGKLDDFIINSKAGVSVAIISLGGFLGEGIRLVAIPATSIKVNNQGRMVLPGTTRAELIALPDFQYPE